MSIGSIKLGDGDEYELKPSDHPVVTDAKVLAWRKQELERMGFGPAAGLLAENGDVDLHDVARWLANGCTLEQALRILGYDELELAVSATT